MPPEVEATLRVALVLPDSTGGILRHVGALAAGLRQRGDAVTVVAPPASLARPPLVGSGAALVELSRRQLRDVARTHDVVHGHGVRVGAGLAMARIGTPVVVTWHNAPIGGAARRCVHGLLERMSARAAAEVLGASEDLVERARRAGARRAAFCPVVAPGSSLAAPAAAPTGAGKQRTVLAIARLAPQKRLDLLVDATAGWADRPDRPRVVVVGDGPLRAPLEQRAVRRRSPVEFLGARDDVAAQLARADVLVLSSEWEARPLVVQEALRAAVPVVATAVGGVPGLVGDAAVLVPPDDASALRDAIERVLCDDGLVRTLREAGPRQASTWPTEEAMVSQIRQAYLDVM